MHSKLYLGLISTLLIILCPIALSCAQPRSPVHIDGKSTLPLRVLARPFANIYKEKDESKGTVEENVPIFQAYYVYARPDIRVADTDVRGLWYQVGSDARGTVIGWMKAEDVFEWKQTMSLVYTHPEGRRPVLMFAQRDPLLALVNSPQRQEKAEQLYALIDSQQPLPAHFPVRSVEPKKAVDIAKQFYLLPILEFNSIEFENGREGRALKLAAATIASREAKDINTNPEYRRDATTEATDIAGAKLRSLALDLVFVMDLTNSMQPYIDATLEAIRSIARQITPNSTMHESVLFGLWGYRDAKNDPKLEFNTKNFTPTLQKITEFEKVLQGVKAAEADSEDYPEDVFSGLHNAMRETRWRDKSLRFIVLVGDAPSHDMRHQRNYSGQNETTLRQFADDQDIYIFALHIKNSHPKLTQMNERAETQFRHLAREKGYREGEREASYYSVKSDDLKGFAQSAQKVAEAFVALVSQAKQGRVPERPGSSAPQTIPPSSDPAALAARMGHAALVEWIGRETEAKAPHDIIAWAVDKDIITPALQTLEVRLLITKSQLDSLKTVLSTVIEAGRAGKVSGETFFATLQATATTMVRTPERIKDVHSLADIGLIPEFLVGLPYKSTIMAMTKESWSRMSTDDQDSLLQELEARIQHYIDIHDTPDGWIQLNKGDDPDEAVYPLSLSDLP